MEYRRRKKSGSMRSRPRSRAPQRSSPVLLAPASPGNHASPVSPVRSAAAASAHSRRLLNAERLKRTVPLSSVAGAAIYQFLTNSRQRR